MSERVVNGPPLVCQGGKRTLGGIRIVENGPIIIRQLRSAFHQKAPIRRKGYRAIITVWALDDLADERLGDEGGYPMIYAGFQGFLFRGPISSPFRT